VLLQTHDCFEGQIQTTADLVDSLDWSHVNPATGRCILRALNPECAAHRSVGIEGRRTIQHGHHPRRRRPGRRDHQMETAILKLEGNRVVFKDKIQVPSNR